MDKDTDLQMSQFAFGLFSVQIRNATHEGFIKVLFVNMFSFENLVVTAASVQSLFSGPIILDILDTSLNM